MTKNDFEIELKKVFPWVDETTFKKFDEYKKCIQEYNQKFNLSRLVSDELIYDQYFLSSLLPFTKLIYFSNSDCNLSVLDIGTGSGIPGIVLKIIYPNLKLCLIESNSKKCNFLEILINKLNLQDVIIKNNRCEDIACEMEEIFDIVTSRAVSRLDRILELSVKFCKIDGHIISLKSLGYVEELEKSQNALNVLNLNMIDMIKYLLDNHTHVVLDFKKTKSTDKQYPRSWNKILNNPL